MPVRKRRPKRATQQLSLRNILQVDGGGTLGRIVTTFLVPLEEALGRPLFEVFDLMSGSSTGLIIVALLALGYSAAEVDEFYKQLIPDLFRKQPVWRWAEHGLYDQRKFISAARERFGDEKMGAAKTRLMGTAVSLCDGETHFFEGWRQGKSIDDRKLRVLDVVSWSAFSAPIYFRPIPHRPTGHVWTDGGVGSQNCTLEQCVIESVKCGWHRNGVDRVNLLSLGCGFTPYHKDFGEAAKVSSVGAAKFFLNRARAQAIPEQVRQYRHGWRRVLKKMRLARLDVELPAEKNRLDDTKHTADYVASGQKLADEHLGSVLRLLR